MFFQYLEQIYGISNFEWIEKLSKATKNIHSALGNTTENGRKNYACDLIGSSRTDLKEVVYFEQSGGSHDNNEKHCEQDLKKVVNESINGLKEKLRNFRDCPVSEVSKLKTFSIQLIENRLTLLGVNIIGPHLYGVTELKTCEIPFGWNCVDMHIDILDMFFFLLDSLECQEKIPPALRQAIRDAGKSLEPVIRCDAWINGTRIKKQ